ncbi:MAG: TolC family protein [Ignavibacteriaceae bacterium]|nr:TolC family protein [Ignavibacteriaceae bacterium]
MKLHSIYFILITIIISSTVINAQRKLSLQEAISLALTQNSSIKKSVNSIDATSEAIKTAYGALIPTLGINGGFDWAHSNYNSRAASNLTGIPNTPAFGGDSRSWSLSIGGDVTLFDGLSSFANIHSKENTLTSANYDLEKLKQDIILQTVTLYTAIVSNKKLLDFQAEDLKYNQALLEKIRQMYAIKSVPIPDVFAQEATTANSELNYIQADNNYRKSIVSLLNFVAMDVTGNYTFTFENDDLKDTSAVPQDFSNLFATALTNRQDYQSEKYKVKISENGVTGAWGGVFPRLTGNYGLSTNASLPGDLFSQKTYSLGLSLSIPIFSQFNTEYAIEFADVQLKNSNEDLTALERQVKTDVMNAHLDLETARKQLDVSKTALASSKESWDAKKEAYTLGAATYLDQQLAYNNYLQAEYTSISKEYLYINSQFTLLSVIGALDK